MGKRGRSQKKDKRSNKKKTHDEYADPHDLDDEIDAFHKQRDIVPLDVNGDVGESSEDDVEHVFDDKNIGYDDEDEDDDGPQDTGLAAKIARQQKFLRAKFGGFGDEINEDEEQSGEETKKGWGGRKESYYGGDNKDVEVLSSDDEDAQLEEEEALRMRRERAKKLTEEDYGLEEVEDESDKELTLEEIPVKGKSSVKPLKNKLVVDTDAKVKKDLNALPKKEQMKVVYSSAPELVGLLSELNDAVEQLETRINPIICKAKKGGVVLNGGMQYFQVKQLLLLAYCQAITFYLLLKSEGHPVQDHPVIARLVEIKSLLDKVKELDGHLPSELEDFLKKNCVVEGVENTVMQNAALALPSDSIAKAPNSSIVLANTVDLAEPLDANQLAKIESLRANESKEGKSKHENDRVGIQSKEMLKVRAALEEKLKQKGLFSTLPSKSDKVQKHMKPVNGKLETYDDFGDDAIDFKIVNCGLTNGHTSSLGSSKLPPLVTAKRNMQKVISGDDDLPKRDDIGERRRKHELKVLASAGIKSEDDRDELGSLEVDEDKLGSLGDDGGSDVEEDGDTGDSEDELYKQTKEKRAAKLAAKAAIYPRTTPTQSLPEIVDGKRQITSQIDKNRGLTRPRKKINKNPRKKYRTKHEKAAKRRKGQVRDIRKPISSYGGETSGINPRISRSIRF